MDGHRRLADQAGQSLVEVLIAIFLTGLVFLAVAGAMLTVLRARTFNQNAQAIDSALVAYSSIIQNQVPYVACPQRADGTSVPDAYFQTADLQTTGSNSVTTQWRRPNNIAVKVLSVRTWNPSTQDWNTTCAAPDSGAQLVAFQVTACPTISSDPACAGGKTRTGEVVKRKPGPS